MKSWFATDRTVRAGVRRLLSGIAVACALLGVPLTDGTIASAQPAPAQQADDDVRTVVRRAVAAYFGLPVDRVSVDTNLVADLKADPVDALEVVAQVCDRLKVEPPRRADLVTIGDIAGYIEDRLAERPRGAPLPRDPGDDTVHVQRILFATDRAPTGDAEPETMFGGARAKAGTVSYGIGEVTIPVAVHVRGQEERPWLQRFEDPRKHIVLRSLTVVPLERFTTELKAMALDAGGDALVFIHGFNVTFAKAARRTAQIAYDLEYRGVPIMYSWPSDGSLIRYLADREDVEWSVPHLEAFLRHLAAAGEVRRLHLIAHSMGNQGLLRALHAIAMRRPAGAPPLFENVILAAPDFDAEVFTDQLAPLITPLSRRWTLYSSDKDVALDASSMMSAWRLGLPLAVAAGVDTVDASGIDVTPWSVPEFHSYYSSKRRVLADLVAVLRGLAPFDRQLLRSGPEHAVFWRLLPN